MNRTWRLVLLIVALIFMYWDIFPGYSLLIAELAVVILLIGEFVRSDCCKPKNVVKRATPKKAVKKKKRR